MKTRFNSLALLGLVSALGLARAQTPAEPAPAPESATPATEANSAATPAAAPAAAPADPTLAQPAGVTTAAAPAAPARQDTLSVDFPDDEVRNILRNVADLFELNVVIPETLQGKTSIKLRDVTWRQIFRVVLNPIGFTYVEEGNIIRIVTTDSLNQEPAVTEVFILNYAKASDVKPSLDSMVDAKVGGKIVVDARSNALIVTERPSAIGRIRPIILSLDKATDQVMIETKFIDVTRNNTENLGINWASLQALGVGFDQKPTIDYEETVANNAARVVEKTTTAVFSADQFRLVVGALNTVNRSRLVSNPTIVTLNNTEASINIGREYPIPNYTYNQERGVFEVSGFNYKPIGVILKVTPQVNNAGFIRLTVEPEVSSSNESVTFGGSGGASIPIIQVRKTKTQVTLKDGFTLGLGGLVESNAEKGDNRVPVLGNIPGLGRLFRSNSQNNSSHDLVVFITAKTVKPDGAEVGEIFDPNMIRAMEIQKSDLPGQRDGSDPFWTPPPPEMKKK